jgi:hypothetical protein
MTRIRPTTALAATAALSASLVAAPALAGSEADVTVKVKSGAPAFHGKVKSDEDLCVANRPVLIKKVKNHGNKTIGANTTDSNGNWTIKIDPLKSAVYFAKAPKLIDVEPGISCIGAKSDKQVVD